MSGTAPYLNFYRRSLKRTRVFLPAQYLQGESATTIKAQKNAVEREKLVGGQPMMLPEIVAIVDPDDLPAPISQSDRITYTGLGESYRVQEWRAIGDGFVELTLGNL